MRKLRSTSLFAQISLAAGIAALAACSSGHGTIPEGAGTQGTLAHRARAKASCFAGYAGTAWPKSPLKIVDDSGLKPTAGWPAIYVLANAGADYLSSTGSTAGHLEALPASGTIPAIPVSNMCANFQIPTSMNRIFIAYGPGLQATDLNAPNERTNKVLFDWIESSPQYSDNSGIGPNINADQFALPIMGIAKDSLGDYYAFGYNNKYGSAIAGFLSSRFAGLHWNALLVCGAIPQTIRARAASGPCPSGQMPLRAIQPYFAAAGGKYSTAYNGFGEVFYSKNLPCPAAPATQCSYMQSLGEFYNAQNQVHPGSIQWVPYITTVNGQPCDVPPTPSTGSYTACPTYTLGYNVSTGVFTFTLKTGSSKTFPATVNVGSGVSTHPLTSGDIFGNVNLPTLGTTVASQVQYYLEKYLQVDLNRGVAAVVPPAGQTLYHPLLPSCMAAEVSPICYSSTYYTAGAVQYQDVYSWVLHNVGVQSFVGGNPYSTTWPWTKNEPGGAYGFPYDDTFSQSSFATIPYAKDVATISSFILCVQPMVPGVPKGCDGTVTP